MPNEVDNKIEQLGCKIDKYLKATKKSKMNGTISSKSMEFTKELLEIVREIQREKKTGTN